MQTTETYDSSLEEKSSKGDRWDDSACGAQVKLSRTRSCRVEFVCGREKENRGPAPRLERTRPDIREVGLETGEAPLWASRFARGVGNKECRSSTPSGSILVRGTRPFSTGGILLVVATPTQLCPPVCVRMGTLPPPCLEPSRSGVVCFYPDSGSVALVFSEDVFGGGQVQISRGVSAGPRTNHHFNEHDHA
ncbi:hypothetical protein DFH06DRAFT_1145233 [Mycena polygramma]|nr:hypothetical protein DFH06DRAFT_1145233 [Mycena polygramma]